MLDDFGILFSTGVILYIILRAVKLDRDEPWFQVLPRKPGHETASKTVWRPRR
jgi:hypothetical protein